MQILSSKCTATVALVALSSLSWINGVAANIKFLPINITMINPGEIMTIRWAQANVNATALNVAPFNLVLRALTGQSYDLNKGIKQDLLQVQATIPSEATGGLHSFYADYTGADDLKSVSTNQFNVSGAIVTTTSPVPAPTGTTATGAAGANATPTHDAGQSGLSGTVLGGIIGGVAAFLILVALIFFFRHRRRVRERSEHTRLEDTKDSYSETSIARSGPPGGPAIFNDKEADMVPVPLSGPSPRPPRPDEHQQDGGPRSQHPMYASSNGIRNPFDGPEETAMASVVMGGATSLSPRQQHQPYQPPQLNQQPSRPMQQQQQQQQPYGMGSPMQRTQNPYQQNRDSIESEPESAYDPAHIRMTNTNNGGNAPIQRNDSNSMMHAGAIGPPSERSILSNPRQQHQQNPFQDRELMAAATGAAIGVAAHQQDSNLPVQAQRQPAQNQHVNNVVPSQSPMFRSTTPRLREIEMQPLDVQQHQYEQQQRMLQRQQQQQQQQLLQQQQEQQEKAIPQPAPQLASQPPQIQAPASAAAPAPIPTPAPAETAAPAHPFNPTLYDDKTELDEDGAPVYNGYRDTIFGAYSQPLGDDEDDDEEEAPVPIVPLSALAKTRPAEQQSAQGTSTTEGAPGVQRKKSVKFTGVPVSGPIEVSATNQSQAQPSQFQHQHQERLSHHGDDESDDDYEDVYEDRSEDEDDIKMRLMETEVPSPASAHARPPVINTSPSSSVPMVQQQQQNALSPVRSPDGTYSAASSPFQQQRQPQYPVPLNTQPQMNFSSSGSVSSIGDGFYQDVLAAVDKNARTLPSATSPTSPTQYIQQQRTPAHQLHHLQPIHVEREVFGAPSPRMTPSSAANNNNQQQQQQQQQGSGYPSPPTPTSSKPALSPRSAARPPVGQKQQQQQEQRHPADADFYESSLL